MSWTVTLATLTLLVAIVCGTLAHEWSHALALRVAGIDYRLEYLPARQPTTSVVGTLASGPWAVVHPVLTGDEPAWKLRLAALMPLSLTLPALWLAATGRLPGIETPIAVAGLIGLLACALPSPQDFSVVFYAHRALEAVPTTEDMRNGSGALDGEERIRYY